MKPRHLLIIAVVLFVAGTLLYRNNAIAAQKQANTIIALDGQSKPVATQLDKLKAYAKQHMNASTELALAGSYGRAVLAAQAAAQQSTQTGAKVYSDAQASCSAKVDSIQLSNCVTAYIAANATPGQTNPQPAMVDKNVYMYKFTSPAWSWDIAGIVLALAALSFVALIASLFLVKPKHA